MKALFLLTKKATGVIVARDRGAEQFPLARRLFVY
jgi:hypothetical protein